MLKKVMPKTQRITQNGAEKGVEIRQTPPKFYRKTKCEKLYRKKNLPGVKARRRPGGGLGPQDTYFQRPPAE